MDAAALEALVIRLFRLNLNWNHHTPVPLSIRQIPASVGDFSSHFTHIKHIFGGRFLLCGSEAPDTPIFCLDFGDPESRLCVLGAWSSTEVPWTSPSLQDFHGRYRQYNDSEITVTALFTVQGENS
jgi:hypothetical protein